MQNSLWYFLIKSYKVFDIKMIFLWIFYKSLNLYIEQYNIFYGARLYTGPNPLML